MSNDRYQEIRDALAMGPTPGPWRADGFEVMAARGQFYGGLILGADDVVVAQMVSAANAPLISACDPDTIRELLTERDALAAEAERLAEALREAADDLERGIDARIVVAQLRARADLLRDQEEGSGAFWGPSPKVGAPDWTGYGG